MQVREQGADGAGSRLLPLALVTGGGWGGEDTVEDNLEGAFGLVAGAEAVISEALQLGGVLQDFTLSLLGTDPVFLSVASPRATLSALTHGVTSVTAWV